MDFARLRLAARSWPLAPALQLRERLVDALGREPPHVERSSSPPNTGSVFLAITRSDRRVGAGRWIGERVGLLELERREPDRAAQPLGRDQLERLLVLHDRERPEQAAPARRPAPASDGRESRPSSEMRRSSQRISSSGETSARQTRALGLRITFDIATVINRSPPPVSEHCTPPGVSASGVMPHE
jgi:hypothetical protein